MKLLGRLWTWLLVPLSMLVALLLSVAIRQESWLSAATLGAGLLFSVLRLGTAMWASGREQAHEDASAAMWRGEEYSVGLDAAIIGVPFLLFVVFGGMALLFALYVDPGKSAWVVFGVCAMCALALALRVFRNPGKLLEITRRGIWDAQFGWVAWPQVQEVSLVEVEHDDDETSSTWLQVRLAGADAAAALPRFGVKLDSIAQQHDERTLRYKMVSDLALHPEQALAAARGWLQAHRTGRGPSHSGDAARVAAMASAASVARAWMRRTTVGAVVAYALFPLAFVADKLRWMP